MKIELNTNICPIIVPDTYGTEFCYNVADDMWDDFKQLMINKAESFINDALAETDFAKAKLEMGKFGSPREYNFTTDWIDFTIEFDERMIRRINDKTMDNADEFFMYAKEYFGSHDGFVSFYPVDRDKFYSALDGKGRLDLAISMYIMWQVEKEYDLKKYQNDYLDDVLDYAHSNGYLDYGEEEAA